MRHTYSFLPTISPDPRTTSGRSAQILAPQFKASGRDFVAWEGPFKVRRSSILKLTALLLGTLWALGCGGGSGTSTSSFMASSSSPSATTPASSTSNSGSSTSSGTGSTSTSGTTTPTTPVSGPIPSSPTIPLQGGTANEYQNNLSATASWVRNNSVSADGAILYGSSQINPYYSNLAAIGLTHDPNSYVTVQNWMHWYIAHLNWPDKYGLFGTTYDYDYANGQATSRNYMDSTDSYAATFLSLAWAYYQTGDATAKSYVASIADKLDAIGGVLIQTQQSDGLTWAKPDYQIKYLMDNCEAYRGLRDVAQVFAAIGNSAKASYYNAAADSMLNGLNGMWTGNNWAVYKDAIDRLSAPNMGTWYADATSQVFPVLMGVVTAADNRAVQAYVNLNAAWPSWASMSYNAQDPFPWILVGDAAIIMGDTARTATFMQQIETKYVNQGFPWTFYSAEAGWFLRMNAYALGARPL